MNYLKTTLLLASVLTLTSSCEKDKYWAVRGKGDITSQTRDIAGFDAIHLSCSANVSYTQDSVYRVVVSALPNVMEAIRIEVKGKELCIDQSKNLWQHKDIKIVVHSPEMRSMWISGSGNIYATNAIHTKNMFTKISGSGNITLPQLYAENAEAKISGSGNIEIHAGEANSTSYSISGSGNINTEFLPSSWNTSHISGSGNIRLHATENINVSISGSGDLHYRGTPAMNADISGSGKIRKI